MKRCGVVVVVVVSRVCTYLAVAIEAGKTGAGAARSGPGAVTSTWQHRPFCTAKKRDIVLRDEWCGLISSLLFFCGKNSN